MSKNKHVPIKLFVAAVCLVLLVAGVVAVTADWRTVAKSTVKNVATQAVADQAKQAAAQAAAAKATATTQLQSILDNFSSPYGTTVGAVVTDLSTGASVSVNENESFVSASIYKAFVAYDVYLHIDQGSVSYDQTVGDVANNNTVSGCLNLMITVSDNDCGVALGELVGWASLDQLLQEKGYTSTILNNYAADGSLSGDKATTAHDVALLFQRLYDGDLLSTASTSNFITLLKADQINTYLPSGLPAGTVIAHKIGDVYGYVHDAGIIYGAKKNVLVVLMTGEWADPATDAPPVFAALSSALWTWMGQ